MRPVDLTMQWRRDDLRRPVSALYFQFRIPPGLSATMGMSFLRSSSLNLFLVKVYKTKRLRFRFWFRFGFGSGFGLVSVSVSVSV